MNVAYTALLQPLTVTVYAIVTVPVSIPVSKPVDGCTVPTFILFDVQTPPGVVLINVDVAFLQTIPVIDCIEFTVM